MDNDYSLAGVFFADDEIIWALATYEHRGNHWTSAKISSDTSLLNRDGEKTARRFPCGDSAKDDLIKAIDEISKHCDFEKLEAITLATLGPYEGGYIKPGSTAAEVTYGTPKLRRITQGCRSPKWSGFEIEKELNRELHKRAKGRPPVGFVLKDAEAFVLGEHYRYRRLGRVEAEGPLDDTVFYLLADTGIGGALLSRGNLFQGDASPEIGHMSVHLHSDDVFDKLSLESCGAHFLPCLEGMLSLSALKERYDLNPEDIPRLPSYDYRLNVIAYYLAQALMQTVFFFAPTVMLLGGRVIENKFLLPKIRSIYSNYLRNDLHPNQTVYFPDYEMQYHPEAHIKPWSSPDAGVLGCLCWSYMMGTDYSQ
ncbi:MAG: ROK family protein [Pseudomonadota bacterium]